MDKLSFKRFKNKSLILCYEYLSFLSEYKKIKNRKLVKCAYRGEFNLTAKVFNFVGHNGIVTNIIKIDHKHILSSSADSTLKLWSTDTGKCTMTFIGHTYCVVNVIRLNLFQVVSMCEYGEIILWDLLKGECLQKYHLGTTLKSNILKHNKHSILTGMNNNVIEFNFDNATTTIIFLLLYKFQTSILLTFSNVIVPITKLFIYK